MIEDTDKYEDEAVAIEDMLGDDFQFKIEPLVFSAFMKIQTNLMTADFKTAMSNVQFLTEYIENILIGAGKLVEEEYVAEIKEFKNTDELYIKYKENNDLQGMIKQVVSRKLRLFVVSMTEGKSIKGSLPT